MTLSNGTIFCVTGPLCGEFTGPGEFLAQRPVTRSFDVFFDLRLNKRLSTQSWGYRVHYDVIVMMHSESSRTPWANIYKYWNWCRCIQRKDSAGVILTASWFNNIKIGYRFHISTVCHSCCNNAMYIFKENLDISGSAWKKISCWHWWWHSCWHGLS